MSIENSGQVHDGDGKRVKSVMNMSNGSTTTYFVASHYEVANEVVTKYYGVYPEPCRRAGSQRIALRTNGTLNYLLGDHLGSTSLTTDANGQVISEMRYKAWGETRYASGTTTTKYTFTGQYSYAGDFGLHFYNARWYDSSLSRFASADTIVPAGVQGYDRYAYVNNSPLKYIDPSGHIPADCYDGEGNCRYSTTSQRPAKVSSTYIILICGQESNGPNCARRGEPNDSLAPYRQMASQQPGRFFILTFDVDVCGTKANCFGQIQKIIDQHPSSNFYFVGHSAGADVAILGANYMVESGRENNLKGVILLDPSLSWTNRDGQKESLAGQLSNIMGKTHIFAGTSPNSDVPNEYQTNQASVNTVLLGHSGTINFSYQNYTFAMLGIDPSVDPGGYLWNAHLALATNQTVFADATKVIK